MSEEIPAGIRLDEVGLHALNRLEDGRRAGIVVTERELGPATESTLADLSAALTAVYGTDQPRLEARPGRPERLARQPPGQLPRGAAPRDRPGPGQHRRAGHAAAGDARTGALRHTFAELTAYDGPRARLAGLLSGLDVRHDLGEGHPLLGRRMPDLDLRTASGPRRVFELLHDARPVLLNLGSPDGGGSGGDAPSDGGPGGVDLAPWADRIDVVDGECAGTWELPVLGAVTAPLAVLIRPDGHVAWVGEGSQAGLVEALTTWFGPPSGPGT